MISNKKTDCSLLQKGAKIIRKTVTLHTKISVIRKMEAGDKRKVCSSPGLAPATVSIIMANAKKKKSLH